jgi:anti-sigma factor RsiW
MEYDAQLKLQAHLDRELPEAEAREVANWLAQDREAVALFAELRNTRQAFVGLEVGIELPESREFFWSKIEREIRLQSKPETTARPSSLLSAWRRFLVPGGAVAALAVAALIGLHSGSGVSTVETAIADTAAFTYHDFSSGTTLVWFSYPAENEVAESAAAGTVP